MVMTGKSLVGGLGGMKEECPIERVEVLARCMAIFRGFA